MVRRDSPVTYVVRTVLQHDSERIAGLSVATGLPAQTHTRTDCNVAMVGPLGELSLPASCPRARQDPRTLDCSRSFLPLELIKAVCGRRIGVATAGENRFAIFHLHGREKKLSVVRSIVLARQVWGNLGCVYCQVVS